MHPKAPSSAASERLAGVNSLFVGIGASAGSLEALNHLFDEMPADSGMILVVVQHLERTHPSMLAELLGKHTQMSVRQVEDGVRAQPDHVYVIPPNAVLTLERGVLRVARPAETGAPEGVEADPRAGSAHRRGPRQACARGRTSRPGERCLESGDRLHLPGTGSNPVSDARWTPALHAQTAA